MSSVAMLIYLMVVRPFNIAALNLVECFNEICILIEGYGLISLSGMNDDPNIKWDAGWALIALIIFNLLVNFLFIARQVLEAILEKCRDMRKDLMNPTSPYR